MTGDLAHSTSGPDLLSRFEPLLDEIGAISDGLVRATGEGELRSTILRCRDALLELTSIVRSDEFDADGQPLRALVNDAWQFTGQDEVLGSPRRSDAEAAVVATDYAIGLTYVHLKRQLSPTPEHCPNCASSRLATRFVSRSTHQPAFALAVCLDCGWSDA